jgi:hypothetical protein
MYPAIYPLLIPKDRHGERCTLKAVRGRQTIASHRCALRAACQNPAPEPSDLPHRAHFHAQDPIALLREGPSMPAISRIGLYIKLSISYIAYGAAKWRHPGLDRNRWTFLPGSPSKRVWTQSKDKYVWKSSQQHARLQKNPECDPRPHRVR